VSRRAPGGASRGERSTRTRTPHAEVRAQGSDGQSLTDFAGELVRTFEECGLQRVIADVRSNGGPNQHGDAREVPRLTIPR
jgi:hypothetical protein